MTSPFTPAWGQPQLFAHGSPEPLPVALTTTAPATVLTFGRALVCELPGRLVEPRQWVFSLALPLLPPLPLAATVALRLQLFVYRPAGVQATVQLKCANQARVLSFRPEAATEGSQELVLLVPLRLVQNNLIVHFQVDAQREAPGEPALITLDALEVVVQ